MPKYSIIVPVYNRPDEIDELLESLVHQTANDFEVIVIEDGSKQKCDQVISKYSSKLDITYLYKDNSGQGFSRNYGFENAKGEWLIFFDSDCVIPKQYFENLENLITTYDGVSAFCGPDAASPNFSSLQKAISYSMTSFLSTGGIRGRKMKVSSNVSLRSYNMVIKASIFDQLGGFAKTNMGEDMELSYRFSKAGFIAMISDELTVYHKRRNTLKSFFKQIFSFGRTRIQLYRQYGIPVRFPHLLPAIFSVGLVAISLFSIITIQYGLVFLLIYAVYFFSILIHASWLEKSLKVGVMSVITTFLQHFAYGMGFVKELIYSRLS